MPGQVLDELEAMPTAADAPRHRNGTARRTDRSRRTQPGRRAVSPITLQVEGLTARAPGGGPLVLDDVGFTVRRGWLVGVVGPTGAGKSSLLAALTGRLATGAGTVRVAGRQVVTGTGVIPGVAHVPQDDVLHGRLALRRTLHHAATLRLPRGTDGPARADRIERVLADLGLTEKARAAIDTLSGGERKRANVAVELVGRPDVVLLDEPTSGLDPGHEQAVLQTLRQVADAGRTVLAVTHGLAALSVCDRVLVLGRGGRVAFFGPPAAAKAFFGSLDAASLFRDLDAVDGTARWADRFRDHPAHAQLVAGGTGEVAADAVAACAAVRPRRRTQLATLVHRAVELTVADRRRLLLLGLQGPVLGLLLLAVLRPHGFVPTRFGGGAATVAMFLAVSATWLGAATAVREIVDELPIVRRERGAGLSLGMYVASKTVVLGSVAAVQAAALAAIAVLRQDPPVHGAVLPSGVLEIVGTSALVGVAAVALGLCVSALVTTSEKALSVLPLVLVTQLVLAGPWSADAATPGLDEARSLTIARWGAEAIEATAAGDARAWRAAVGALVVLTVAALAATFVLVRRRAGFGRPRRPATERRPRLAWAIPATALATAIAALALLPSGSSGASDRADDVASAQPDFGAVAGAAGVSSTPSTAPPSVAVAVAPPTTSGASGAEEAQGAARPVTRVETTAAPAVDADPVAESPIVAEPPVPTTAVPVVVPPAAPPTTTTTIAPPPTTTTTAPPSTGGSMSANSSWDWVWWWWQVARAYG